MSKGVRIAIESFETEYSIAVGKTETRIPRAGTVIESIENMVFRPFVNEGDSHRLKSTEQVFLLAVMRKLKEHKQQKFENPDRNIRKAAFDAYRAGDLTCGDEALGMAGLNGNFESTRTRLLKAAERANRIRASMNGSWEVLQASRVEL